MDLAKLKKVFKGKNLIYGLAGAAVLYLLYRYFSSKSGGTASDPTIGQPTPDQTGLTAAEQVGAQEAADVSQLQADLGDLSGQIDEILTAIAGGGATDTGGTDTASVAAGHKKTKRPKKKGQHPGNKKPNKKATGKAPKPHHPKGHQSNRKHGGTGAVAPSGHGRTPGTKLKGVSGVLTVATPSGGKTMKLKPAKKKAKKK